MINISLFFNIFHSFTEKILSYQHNTLNFVCRVYLFFSHMLQAFSGRQFSNIKGGNNRPVLKNKHLIVIFS